MTTLAAYNFDEASGDFLDATGSGHDIPIGANAARSTGHTGSALTKINTGLPVLAEPAIGQTANRTLMFWLQGTGGTWWVRWDSSALGSGAWGMLNLGGFACVQARDAAGNLLTPRPQVEIPDGDWHHYAATYDGSTVRLYLDAVLVSSGSLAGGIYTGADRVDIAEWSTAATFLDDLRILDEALDQAAIAALMNTPVSAGAPPVEEAGFTIPLSLDVAPGAVEPVVGVPQAGFTIPLQVDVIPGEPDPTPMASAPELGGWRTLQTIAQWNAEEYERERTTDPVACPAHGDPLDSHNGRLHCPMGHFVQRA